MQNIKPRLEAEKPVKWLFTGDSITHGACHTYGHRDYVQLFEERIRYELGRRRDVVIRTAVSGWTAEDIAEDIEWNVVQHHPDVVSLMVGINDANRGPSFFETFSASMTAIIDRVISIEARMILHTPNPTVPGAHENCENNLPRIVEWIRATALERGIPLVDNFAEFQRAWEEQPLRTGAWMNDALHPGMYGHRALARLLLKEIGIWDERALSCRGLIP